MNRSGLLLVACFAFLCAAAPALGDAYVELDFDGIVGNGPEYNYCIDVGSFLWVDVWLLGDLPVRGFRISICDPSGCLEFFSHSYVTPSGWATQTVAEGECVVLQAEETVVTGVPQGTGALPESWGGVKSRFRGHGERLLKSETMTPLQLPARVATLAYSAMEENCIVSLTIDEAIYVDADYATGTFQGNNGCRFFIQWCDSGKSPYGSVKTLFR